MPRTVDGRKTHDPDPNTRVVPLTYRQASQARSAIKAGALIRRLQHFALGEMVVTPDGNKRGKKRTMECYMSPDQVRAAFGLLAKVLPDLARVELAGGEDIGANAQNGSLAQIQQSVLMTNASMTQNDAAMEYQRLMLESPDLDKPTPAKGRVLEHQA